jgi:uncharacterized membrane protein YeaQ/YmgE (transglycosylase-associated protein family)
MGFIWFLLIGLVAGWLAGKITRGSGFGALGNMGVGVIGAMLGGFVFRLFGVYTVGLVGSLVTATGGAILLLWLLRRFKH